MQAKPIRLALLFAPFLFAAVCAQAQPASPQQTLQQYVADLQNNPNDTALRQKIIALAQTMNPPPALPEDAERYMARGTAAVEGAQNAGDFKDAVAEFEKATLAAPWLADAYYNLGVAEDKAGMYDAAIRSLNLYLFAAPNATDSKQVKTLIYEVEYRRDKAAKASSAQAAALQQQTEYEQWLKKLDGARYSYENPAGFTQTIDIRGHYIQYGTINRSCSGCGPIGVWQASQVPPIPIQGREFTEKYGEVTCTSTISEEGITGQCTSGTAQTFRRTR